eukprot:EG_transcript_45066
MPLPRGTPTTEEGAPRAKSTDLCEAMPFYAGEEGTAPQEQNAEPAVSSSGVSSWGSWILAEARGKAAKGGGPHTTNARARDWIEYRTGHLSHPCFDSKLALEKFL